MNYCGMGHVEIGYDVPECPMCTLIRHIELAVSTEQKRKNVFLDKYKKKAKSKGSCVKCAVKSDIGCNGNYKKERKCFVPKR